MFPLESDLGPAPPPETKKKINQSGFFPCGPPGMDSVGPILDFSGKRVGPLARKGIKATFSQKGPENPRRGLFPPYIFFDSALGNGKIP